MEVLHLLALAFEQQIGFSDGVSLRIYLLPEEMNGELLALLFCNLL